MRFSHTLFVIPATILLLIQCQRNKNHSLSNVKQDKEFIEISGSNSEYELVKYLLDSYNEQREQPMKYTLEGAGSEKGIEKLIKGEIDMAMSSRRIKPYEANLIRKNGNDFIEIIFAVDALSFITNYKNSVDSLSIEQIRDILSGKIINWYQVSKFKGLVRIYGRNLESGTFHFVEDKFGVPALRKYQQTCTSSHEIIQRVMEDTCGFGYVSIGYLLDSNKKLNKKIWPVPIYVSGAKMPSMSPLQVNEVSSGYYPVIRPLYQYFRLPIPEKLKNFLEFELSVEGQKLVESKGFYRINTQHQIQNNIQLLKLKDNL